MPVLKITTNQAIELGANLLLDNLQLSPQRKRDIKRVTEFNLSTIAFNASTILIVAAVAAAVLFAYTAAFTLGAIGLFLRYATEKEITKYTLSAGQDAMWARFRDVYNGALSQTTPEWEIRNTFMNIGLPPKEGWEPISVTFENYALWRNLIEVPPEGA